MPYKSEKMRKFMYSQKPEIAKRWDKEGKNHIDRKNQLNALKKKVKK